MTSISEIKLKVSAPLLGDKSVMYLSNGKCPGIDRCIRENLDSISDSLSEYSYKFIYLPELLSSLSSDVRSYLFPGLTDSSEESVNAHLQSLFFKGEHRNGFIRKKDDELFFYELPDTDTYDIWNIICEYTDSLAEGSTVLFSRNVLHDSADEGIRFMKMSFMPFGLTTK